MAHQQTPPMEHSVDAWHAHAADEPQPQAEHASQINRGVLLIVFVAMVVSILVMVIGLTIFYNYSQAQLRAERIENVVEYERYYQPTYRLPGEANVATYRWLDNNEGTVQIPVERAAARVAERYAEDAD
ncbi:MAG: hypothetical protein AAGB48_01080 [Planctomycetota bacterium]